MSPEELELYAVRTFGKSNSDIREFKKYIKYKDKVLEVGCGTGRVGVELIKDCQYIGIDRSGKFLNVFREKLDKKGLKYNSCQIQKISFEDFCDKNNSLDVVLFPWTIIGDFNKDEQIKVLKKTYDLLVPKGICLIDNPSKNQEYNTKKYYNPIPFYYEDWANKLSKLGFSHSAKLYLTNANRERELTILKKS